jgi:hypothetical protein
MADASGTPTPKYNIPKYNTALDAPSGKGNSSQMDAIDNALALVASKAIVMAVALGG